MIDADPTELHGLIYTIYDSDTPRQFSKAPNFCCDTAVAISLVTPDIRKMQYLASMLTLLSATLATAPQEYQIDSPFTVNLLTKVGDMSIISPGGQIPISCTNATKHQIYETNVAWSVIGSATFQEEQVPQWYLIDTNLWSANVSFHHTLPGVNFH